MDLKIKNRELSWLSFNARVLQEANDPSVPLIERIKFLGICSSNLDEFFRVRVAGLRRMVKYEKQTNKLLGFSPQEVLNKIYDELAVQQRQFDKIYQSLVNELKRNGTRIVDEKNLTRRQQRFVKSWFRQHVMPTLAPVMTDKIVHFPFLKDKSIYFAVRMWNREEPDKHRHALVEIPTDILPRFVVIPTPGRDNFVILLDDIIRFCLDDVFYVFNCNCFDAWTIKLTRDAELEMDAEFPGNLTDKLAKSLKKRSKGVPVRFVYDESLPQDLLKYFVSRMHLNKEDLIPGGRYHNFKDFIAFPRMNRPDWIYPRLRPLRHKNLRLNKSIINAIRDKDAMVHFPYQSFDYVINFLREASIDPKVKSIKITLYRVAKNSNVVNALINAVKNGKTVTVIMELQARFDEEANLYWAKKMEEEGIRVIYGKPEQKIHCKMCLVEREEENGLVVQYANLGTGNYNEETARIYCDHSYFTSDNKITAEIARLFGDIESGEKPAGYQHLVVAPAEMRKKFMNLFDLEIKNAKEGKEAWAIVKLNHLADHEIINKMYEAGNNGVNIRLIVRSTCSLVPGVKGFSGNINAISIVDRFLEHARVYVFSNGGVPEYFVSSADWMVRNFDSRIELAYPVYDKDIQKELREILEIQLRDNVKARVISEHDNNLYRRDSSGKKVRTQEEVYRFLGKGR
jgi:polyphosphate kinase